MSALRTVERFIGVSVLLAIAVWSALFFVAGLAVCSIAHAGETWIVGSVASHHFASGARDYEQRNWGLGIEHEMTKTIRVTAGFYRNSNRVDSLYYGAVWTPIAYGIARLGLAAELVSGYESNGSREPVKALFPVLALERGSLGINIPFIPRTNRNHAAIALQVKVRW